MKKITAESLAPPGHPPKSRCSAPWRQHQLLDPRVAFSPHPPPQQGDACKHYEDSEVAKTQKSRPWNGKLARKQTSNIFPINLFRRPPLDAKTQKKTSTWPDTQQRNRKRERNAGFVHREEGHEATRVVLRLSSCGSCDRDNVTLRPKQFAQFLLDAGQKVIPFPWSWLGSRPNKFLNNVTA